MTISMPHWIMTSMKWQYRNDNDDDESWMNRCRKGLLVGVWHFSLTGSQLFGEERPCTSLSSSSLSSSSPPSSSNTEMMIIININIIIIKTKMMMIIKWESQKNVQILNNAKHTILVFPPSPRVPRRKAHKQIMVNQIIFIITINHHNYCTNIIMINAASAL